MLQLIRITVLTAVAVCFAIGPIGHAQAPGVEWQEISLDEALAEAEKTGKIIMINVHADHCHACHDMDDALWQSPDGGALADGLIALQIDSTTPEGQELNRRYPVTGLPLVLFISPEGKEIDRVVGYTSNHTFLAEAEPLKTGYDPLPDLEAALAAKPDSLLLIMPVFERYLFRLRDAEAESPLTRILELDSQNRYRQSTKALIKIAKHSRIVRNDMEKCLSYWKLILDRFPNSSSAGGALNGTHRAAMSLRKIDWWKEYVCGLLEKHPNQASLHYSAAMTAKRYMMRGSCWADAARRARQLGKGGAFLDTLAVTLEESGSSKQ
jgi:thioredoxin-related protein